MTHVSPLDATRRLKPLTPERLRYARWFIDAGWRVAMVAWLFDVAEFDLGCALGWRAP